MEFQLKWFKWVESNMMGNVQFAIFWTSLLLLTLFLQMIGFDYRHVQGGKVHSLFITLVNTVMNFWGKILSLAWPYKNKALHWQFWLHAILLRRCGYNGTRNKTVWGKSLLQLLGKSMFGMICISSSRQKYDKKLETKIWDCWKY